MLRLKKRSEFLAAARGVRLSRRGFVLQAIRRTPEDKDPARVGFTVTKKVGNAVIRNRVKRRLREVARLLGPEHLQSGWDYVLIGKYGALHLPFDSLCADFKGCVRDLASGKTDAKRRASGRSGHRKTSAGGLAFVGQARWQEFAKQQLIRNFRRRFQASAIRRAEWFAPILASLKAMLRCSK